MRTAPERKWHPQVRDLFRVGFGFTAAQQRHIERVVYPQLAVGDDGEYYKKFFIWEGRKRRTIEAPTSKLKFIQKRLLHRFWYRIGISYASHGFTKKRSPVTNAAVHAETVRREKYFARGRKETLKHLQVLRVDVRDFFHRIKYPRVWRAASLVLHARWKPNGMDEKAIRQASEIIMVLCCKDGRLPMGSPCSPAISNVVMARFDGRMKKYCKSYNLRYTRYADDIVVSGKGANRAFKKIEAELALLQMKPHEHKTKVMRCHRRQRVTGVVVNSGKPTISRQERRRLRAQMHHTMLHYEQQERGSEESLLCMPTRPESVSTLVGLAGWVASVNPSPSHQKFRGEALELLRLRRSVTGKVERNEQSSAVRRGGPKPQPPSPQGGRDGGTPQES